MSENENPKKNDDQFGNPHGDDGEKVMDQMNHSHRPYIEWGLLNLPKIDPKSILDVGFGGGIVTRYILRAFPKAKGYGLDISEDALEYASKYNKYFIDEGRLSYIVGDVADMPYEDGRFDLVITNASYFFWPDLAGSLKEIARVIAKGGIFCFPIYGPITDEIYEKEASKWAGKAKLYKDSELEAMLKDAGFETTFAADPDNEFVATFTCVKK
ncbi:SAM-dependent methlyltransferase [methanogenic archaeon mixed culture ISO4-G1]|nr:SAM-dependent methlyltransferase [methanogenic archaeon mixed culture ISO4-G1]